MIKYFALCLIAIFLIVFIGCSLPAPKPFVYVKVQPNSEIFERRLIKVYIDRQFSKEDVKDINKAIIQWNYVLNGYIRLFVVSTKFDMEPEIIRDVEINRDLMILKISSTNSMVPPDSPYKSLLAFANAIGGTRVFVIRDRINDGYVFGIVMHELGHILGAKHSKSGLMYPTYNNQDYKCIDLVTVKEVAQFQSLPLDNLGYCVEE